MTIRRRRQKQELLGNLLQLIALVLVLQTSCYCCWAKQVIMLGSSGLVGGLVLDQLLESPTWDKISVVVRKPLKRGEHPKLNQIVVSDLNTIPTNPELRALATARATDGAENKIDAAIITFGVNEPWKMTLQEYVDIDVKLTQLFANYCAEQLKVNYISLLSAVGSEQSGAPFTSKELATSINGWNVFTFVLRTKGMIEDNIVQTGIPNVALFQPSNFETDEYRFGTLDIFLQNLMKVLNFVLPHKSKSIHVKDLSYAMFQHLEEQFVDTSSSTEAGASDNSGVGGAQQRVSKLTYKDMMEYKKSKKNSSEKEKTAEL